MQDPELDRGKIVPSSLWRSIQWLWGGLLFSAFGIGLTWLMGYITFNVWRDYGFLSWGMLVSLLFLFLAASFALACLWMLGRTLYGFVDRESIVVGKNSIQRIRGRDRVLDHIPYANIQDIELNMGTIDSRVAMTVIIHLRDRNDENTRLARFSGWVSPDPAEANRLSIDDIFQLPADELQVLMYTHWAKSIGMEIDLTDPGVRKARRTKR